MKILFIGCVEGSYKLLEVLLRNQKNVVGVITKKKSSFNADFMDLTPLCRNYGIPVHYATSINDKDSLEFIRKAAADIGFCFGWSQLLEEEAIRLFPKGVVGFHPAALPNNRGRHPIIWALALGLTETASTFFMMNSEADAGDIVSQKSISINYEDDARTLCNKVMNIAVEQEMRLVTDFEDEEVKYVPQSTDGRNTWRKRGKADGEIDWRMSSRCIYNLVRALTKPYVGAHFCYNGKEYKVWKVQEIVTQNAENIEPGKVLAVYADGTVDVKVGEGGIRLLDSDFFEIEEGDYIL